jgi:deoxyribonuclease-4
MGQTAESIGANVFQFFTRNPRGGAAKNLDKADIKKYLEFAAENSIGPILAHAPYTLNAASADKGVREFAESIMADDLKRLRFIPGSMYNFHPGSHVSQGIDVGIGLISGMLTRLYEKDSDSFSVTTVLLETMSGKGSEVGGRFEELKAIIDKVPFEIGVCMDTCHVWDAGYDVVNDLDGVLEEFDDVVGLERLKAVHLNDSMNNTKSHKDRHEKIGKGKIGLEAMKRIINHPKLEALPFFLETPCDLQGYKEEIELLKSLKA